MVAALAVVTRGSLVGERPDTGPSAGLGPSPSTALRTVPWLREPARPRAPTPTVPEARLADLAVSIQAPNRAVIGQPLRYSVTIANAGGSALPLRPCPNYDQRLAVEGARAMRLDVPTTLPPGRAVLIWNLDLGPGAQFKPIEVVRG